MSEFVHALRADHLMEAAHLALEEGFTVAVWRRITTEDVPAVGEELPPNRTGDLVACLAPVDHRPSPFAELRVRARSED